MRLQQDMKICKVYEEAVEFINDKLPQLREKLPANFGFGVSTHSLKSFNFDINFAKQIGLEFRESSLYINGKNDKVVEEGMVFNVVVGFDGLLSEEDRNYAI